jgi:hypothetical protein
VCPWSEPWDLSFVATSERVSCHDVLLPPPPARDLKAIDPPDHKLDRPKLKQNRPFLLKLIYLEFIAVTES